ncbi:hypothetical protein ANCCAN_23991 [Ancylostoma caninum]|uniref:Uncharacterized protein n=1 Tax=Ancylostoma caninum TaxID=29170 RepID=A0A368FH83_ANCCA|nr:hypothetical protein ANCCAN_23991 [Ancylostoma caninum]
MKVRPAPWQIKPQLPKSQKDLKKGDEIEVSSTARLIATLCTVFVGCLYGNMLTPVSYLIVKYQTAGNPMHYTTFFFSFCVGAILTSTVIFMIYSGFRKNRPFVNPELTLPSLVSGLMYGGATCCFFIASEHLDPVSSSYILKQLLEHELFYEVLTLEIRFSVNIKY